jgi:NTP pyrophosphatase (non-canonical NTP hydrolase)
MVASIQARNLSDLVTLNDYQEFTRLTDQNKKTGYAGFMLPFLGIYGEVGSLLSELKKKQRDAGSYVGYAESVVEELGDVMWYFTNIAARANLSLETLAQRMTRELHDWDEETHDFRTFDDLQSRGEHAGPTSGEKFERGAIALAAKVGRLLDHVSIGSIEGNRDLLSADLVEILRAIVQAADDADVSLQEAVQRNIKKVTSRWPIERIYPPLFDDRLEGDEQLPRHIKMLIAEKRVGDEAFVVQTCNGIKIGDRLTDNKAEQDDYRFHDVFHLSYAAILGWSPVTRALFKMKRKSDPRVDENEDGARAVLIEEGVATWIFNDAIRLNYFAEIQSLDYTLLKAVKELVKGYEVEACPMWLWEKAILDGFKAFRFLKEHRRGLITADLIERRITVEAA